MLLSIRRLRPPHIFMPNALSPYGALKVPAARMIAASAGWYIYTASLRGERWDDAFCFGHDISFSVHDLFSIKLFGTTSMVRDYFSSALSGPGHWPIWYDISFRAGPHANWDGASRLKAYFTGVLQDGAFYCRFWRWHDARYFMPPSSPLMTTLPQHLKYCHWPRQPNYEASSPE